MGTGVNTHGVGAKWEYRRLKGTSIGAKALIGVKISLTQVK